ncbi:MAG: FAD-binding oxidoreductase [Abditibacteriota bacterium]|nr:FAD-binding oxidoreductase [Abditibacteriota bacterium]
MNSPFVEISGAAGGDYVSDESRLRGRALGICLPDTAAEAARAVAYAAGRSLPLTVQGGLTGITGGAVPMDSCILNLSRLTALGDPDGDLLITAGAGVSLDALRSHIAPRGLCFPPDPTESSALLGGMAATNASGAVSFGYGPMRRWTEGLELVTADGELRTLRRGEVFASGYDFELFGVRGTLPRVHPVNVKSAAGLYIRPDMDLLDLFIGSEGILAVITGVTLRLTEQPQVCGAIMFLDREETALSLTERLRQTPELHTAAIEYFDGGALGLLTHMRESRGAFEHIRRVPEGAGCAIYAELHPRDDSELEVLLELTEEYGIEEDRMLCGFDPEALQPLKAFRHAVPEAVNMLIGEKKRRDPSITKLGTDMSVPDEYLRDTVAMYRRDLEESGLDFVIFGHIGDNHLHVNIIPDSAEEYARGKELYKKWAARVASLGGSVSAEHGIGKLKKDFLPLMYSPEELEGMRYLKGLFDPSNILNRGNML